MQKISAQYIICNSREIKKQAVVTLHEDLQTIQRIDSLEKEIYSTLFFNGILCAAPIHIAERLGISFPAVCVPVFIPQYNLKITIDASNDNSKPEERVLYTGDRVEPQVLENPNRYYLCKSMEDMLYYKAYQKQLIFDAGESLRKEDITSFCGMQQIIPEFDIPFLNALMSENPARMLGLETEGQLMPSFKANIMLLENVDLKKLLFKQTTRVRLLNGN